MIAVPWLALALMASNLLRYAVDLPIMDDWRSYTSGQIGSFEPSYLFKSANDTLYPVGKVLDAIAFHTLSGNSVAYKFMSMVAVLGSLLWLQWRLLSTVLRDRLLAAGAFAFTLPMLNPGTYWTGQDLAYHQALPLICLLGALYLIICVRWPVWLTACLLSCLGLLAGLSYISGAFAILATACAVLFAAWSATRERAHFYYAATLGAAGLICSILQVRVIVISQRGGIHRPDAEWAWPWSSDFWMYLLGKVAQSAMLPRYLPALSLTLVLLLIGLALWAVLDAWRGARADGKRDDPGAASRLLVLLGLGVSIAAYLALVSAGRAKLGQVPDASPLQVFAHGYSRFHFFWVTLLWPWVAASVIAFVRPRLRRGALTAVTAVMAAASLGGAVLSGVFDSARVFRQSYDVAQRGLACMQMQVARSSGKIRCPEIYPGDLAKAYRFAVLSNASFVRYVPPSLRAAIPPPDSIVALDGPTDTGPALVNAERVGGQGDAIQIEAQSDAQIVFRAPAAGEVERCRTLFVGASVTGQKDARAQLFYLPTGAKAFSERDSLRAKVSADGNVAFVVTSPTGFQSRLRFDPVSQPGQVTVAGLSVICIVGLAEL